jgi:hypothetical protein
MQNCKCGFGKYWYEPKKTTLQEIDFYKSYNSDDKKFVAVAKFYKDDGWEERYFKVEINMIVENFSDEIPALVNPLKYGYRVVFTSLEECQKYCDWKNREEARDDRGSQ